MTPDFFKAKFDQALTYADYLQTGTPEQQLRWRTVEPLTHLSDAQISLLGGFVRTMHVLCISGIWCGDCVQQGPMLHSIASANRDKIILRFVDRDLHKDLSDQFKLNGGHRVPTVIFLSEDFAFCGVLGDRTISRYRAMASRQLGASCPVGIAPPDAHETADTIADWVHEFERVQLMLRLSPRLRTIHKD